MVALQSMVSSLCLQIGISPPTKDFESLENALSCKSTQSSDLASQIIVFFFLLSAGKMTERLNVPVWKTGFFTESWVRIPLFPISTNLRTQRRLILYSTHELHIKTKVGPKSVINLEKSNILRVILIFTNCLQNKTSDFPV